MSSVHFISSLLYKLHSLDTFVRIDAGRVVAGLSTVFLGEGRSVFHVIFGGAVEFFLKDRLLFVGLELCLEVVEGLGATVRSSSSVGVVDLDVFSVVGQSAPTMRRSD